MSRYQQQSGYGVYGDGHHNDYWNQAGGQAGGRNHQPRQARYQSESVSVVDNGTDPHHRHGGHIASIGSHPPNGWTIQGNAIAGQAFDRPGPSHLAGIHGDFGFRSPHERDHLGSGYGVQIPHRSIAPPFQNTYPALRDSRMTEFAQTFDYHDTSEQRSSYGLSNGCGLSQMSQQPTRGGDTSIVHEPSQPRRRRGGQNRRSHRRRQSGRNATTEPERPRDLNVDVDEEQTEPAAGTSLQLAELETRQHRNAVVARPGPSGSATSAIEGYVAKMKDSLERTQEHLERLTHESCLFSGKWCAWSTQMIEKGLDVGSAMAIHVVQSHAKLEAQDALICGMQPSAACTFIERLVDAQSIWSRQVSICMEINDLWPSETWQRAMTRVGKELRSAAFDGLPFDYEDDRNRTNAYLCQCQFLLDSHVNFRELVSSAKDELHLRLMNSYQSAEDAILGSSDGQVARSAVAVFKAESEICRPSRFVPQILREFDVKLRKAYINLWPFAEPSRPAALFIKTWSDLREVLAQAFAGCPGIEAISTSITQEELDEAVLDVPSPLDGLSSCLTSEGVQHWNDPRIVQALTLRGDIRPEIEVGVCHFYDLLEILKFFDDWQTARVSGFVHPHASEAVVSSAQQLLETISRQIIEHNDQDDQF